MSVNKLTYAGGNNVSDTLSSSIGAADSTIPVNSIAIWPNTTFTAVIDKGVVGSEEYVAISGTSGSSLTVAGRGQQSTTGVGHNAGASIEAVPTAGDWNNVIDALANSHLVTTGAVDTTKIVTPSGTQTLTNKRHTKRVYSTTSTATLTPEISTYDIFVLTALATNLTIANHSTSTPTDGEMIMIEIQPDATPRTLTFGTNYVAKAGTALPTTTTASKRLTMIFIWAADLSKWNLLYSGLES